MSSASPEQTEGQESVIGLPVISIIRAEYGKHTVDTADAGINAMIEGNPELATLISEIMGVDLGDQITFIHHTGARYHQVHQSGTEEEKQAYREEQDEYMLHQKSAKVINLDPVVLGIGFTYQLLLDAQKPGVKLPVLSNTILERLRPSDLFTDMRSYAYDSKKREEPISIKQLVAGVKNIDPITYETIREIQLNYIREGGVWIGGVFVYAMLQLAESETKRSTSSTTNRPQMSNRETSPDGDDSPTIVDPENSLNVIHDLVRHAMLEI
ncbi:MAG: hypothetical protein ACYDBX_00015 [Patescibacteria group bacterium]